MQHIPLNFYQRVMLWNMVGNYNAPNLKEASIYLRIIEKLRLTDREQLATEFTTNGQQYNWRLPSPDYGTKTVALESDESTALVAAIEAANPVRVIDAEWLQGVVDTIKSPSPALELVTNA